MQKREEMVTVHYYIINTGTTGTNYRVSIKKPKLQALRTKQYNSWPKKTYSFLNYYCLLSLRCYRGDTKCLVLENNYNFVEHTSRQLFKSIERQSFQYDYTAT